MPVGRARSKISGSPRHNGLGSNVIARAAVMQGHGDLNQALPIFLFSKRRGPPNVFQHFMGGKEIAGIEQLDSFQIIF